MSEREARPASGLDDGFLAGAIEGFYGPPWSQGDRLQLFDWLADFGLDTYLYAPKDDLKHRALWRECYSGDEADAQSAMVRACRGRGLRFVYAISPGLDIRFGDQSDLDRLRARVEQMLAWGCEHFALLFDDIPAEMRPEDRARWGSLASAHSGLTNAVCRWVRDRHAGARVLFCPTPYCGRMAERQLGGAGYLETVGRELDADIAVFWTGPEIVSREISVDHVRGLHGILRRKPLIWDNLHANDYDGRRFFCGPYAGRPAELRREVAGILANPNTEHPLNYVPLRTLGEFVRGGERWDARRAYLDAMAGWLPSFRTAGVPIEPDDLLMLGDCYYLPHEDGPLAGALFDAARRLLRSDPAAWGNEAALFEMQAGRLRDTCGRTAELLDRRLFHALSRRTWELREELDLLVGYVRARRAEPGAAVRSDFHLPGTYRGSLVSRLQELLVQRPDGTFSPVAGRGAES